MNYVIVNESFYLTHYPLDMKNKNSVQAAEIKNKIQEWYRKGKYAETLNFSERINDRGGITIKTNLYTDNYIYQIVATTDTNYLGGQASKRKPAIGEDWTRGNDIADGRFKEETWNKIMFDIVSYEVVGSCGNINTI